LAFGDSITSQSPIAITNRRLIDLHLHTVASDGRSSPAELVALAAAAGVSVMAATDHDTVASCREVAEAARRRGIEAITGIEITAVEAGRDVHMLGYFLDIDDPVLADFLAGQRQTRMARVERIAQRLGELGKPVDVSPVLTAAAVRGQSIGRPQVAEAMIVAGYVTSRREAFDRWLGAGRPAFVEREGASPESVIEVVHAARGVISLAHPGRTGLPDHRISRLVASGLDALEVYHSEHDAGTVSRYAALADRLGTLRSGGSDFHGDPGHALTVGSVSLPWEHWDRLRTAAQRRH
jgi:predicted metal-dependent phosphoesterase TrpH